MSGFFWFSLAALVALAEAVSPCTYLAATAFGFIEVGAFAFLGVDSGVQIMLGLLLISFNSYAMRGFSTLPATKPQAIGTVDRTALPSAPRRSLREEMADGMRRNDHKGGTSVRVIKWNRDGSAIVRYKNGEWKARKLNASMPNSMFGSVCSEDAPNGRLTISTI